jgi:SAM-dependent methyltransferase
MTEAKERWASGDRYEPYVGRWSRLVAREFVDWLGAPAGLAWLDVGCGTGALASAVAERCGPRRLAGIDPSAGFLALAERRLAGTGIELRRADAQALPFADAEFDRIVSGLVLNFVPDPARALATMRERAATGGTVAAYVWDYAEGMELLRIVWDAAVELDPGARVLDEGLRFPLCRPDPLRACFQAAGALDPEVRPIEVPTVFRDVDDYWSPFLGGQGPAPGYVASLDGPSRDRLRDTVVAKLPIEPDGSIRLTARAWAVRGRAPAG